MHFLNGGRLYIKPDQHHHGFEQQLASCLDKLEQLSQKKRICKLNFFTDAATSDDYLNLKKRLEKKVVDGFPAPILCSLIAQPPLTCHIVAEAFYFDDALWRQDQHSNEKGSAIAFEREGAAVLIGQVQACRSKSCSANASVAFEAMENLLGNAGFSMGTVVRQWNYIENILAYDGIKQRYQEFNNVRASFYGNSFQQTGFPAATGIGIKQGGILMEFIAVNAPGVINLPVDNPQQVAAHDYSRQVLAGENHTPKLTPKFERARYLELFGRQQLFISGTASIRGEKTAAAGDPEEQTRITIENIQRLYSGESIFHIAGKNAQPKYGHARVYIKNHEDFSAVKKTFKKFYGNLPVVYLLADVCRDDLLVEIEGKVILERQRQNA